MLTHMNGRDDRTLFSKEQLLELLAQQEQQFAVATIELQAQESQLAVKDSQLAAKEEELQSQRWQLREQDIALQTKDLQIEELKQQSQEWELAYNELLQRAFAKKSERYLHDPNQLRLDFGDTPEAADAANGLADAVEEWEQTIPAHKRRRRKKRDESLPAHLRREEVIAELPEGLENCPLHGERQLLPKEMWDRQETLKFKRPELWVLVTLFPKYACPNSPECGIASPERPTSIVEGNKYDSSVAAEIITGKYSYHLPLYRLQDYFAGSGWTPTRSTQNNILANCHFIFEPVLKFFKAQVQSDSVVGCDDTGLTLLYPKVLPTFDLDDPKQRRMHEVFSQALEKNKSSISAKMWAYRGQTIKLNVFDFTVSRHRDGPEFFFTDYEGVLLGDCYSGFESIVVASDGAIVRAACNAHARRKIRNSKSYPEEAARWLLWYQQLYDIETRGKLLSAEERLTLRQAEAKPIWDEMELWLAAAELRTQHVILPKSDFGKALQYVRNHLPELKRYLDNGLIPIDNNETEQLMKQIAIARKNWLFAGSVAGGERSAGFLTLTSSAIRNDLDVWLYVKDVLDQLLAGRTDYEPLLPWNWAQAHPEAIRQYRVEERNDRADRQQIKRALRRSNQNT